MAEIYGRNIIRSFTVKEVTSLENALGADDHVIKDKKVAVKKARPLDRKVNT